jgi:hypothetical protein
MWQQGGAPGHEFPINVISAQVLFFQELPITQIVKAMIAFHRNLENISGDCSSCH